MGGNVDLFRPTCGLPINTYFSALKMRWLLENSPEVMRASDQGSSGLTFSTIDTWLIAKLSGMESVMTDATNASRTMLMDIDSLEWSEEMLNAFEIKREWLPEISKSSSANFGVIKEGKLANVPITGAIGDQQSACLGHILRPGQVKNTYGTGCFILANVGDKPV